MVKDWLLIPLALGMAVLMAAISYEFFESRFIRRKKKFSKVLSGENVKPDEKEEAVEQAVTA